MIEPTFSREDLTNAADELATIPYFPVGSRAAVIVQLAKMVPHRRALDWLISTAVARCKTWPGMSDLRGLLCTRFDAADGIDEPNCGIPGYTADECEARFIEAHEATKANAQLAPESAKLIKQLASAKQIGGQ